jgi:CheY-like chemotaxis protein
VNDDLEDTWKRYQLGLPPPVFPDGPAVHSDNRWKVPSAAPVHESRSVNRLDDYPFTGKVFLVVDDDFRNAFALSALLERGRADIAVAESGLEAIAALEQASRTDLVLMDIMMPGMDGYTTMRSIRNRERFIDLPIIAVTGKVVDGERERCIEAGANDFLVKPVVTAQLLSVIETWLTNSPSKL